MIVKHLFVKLILNAKFHDKCHRAEPGESAVVTANFMGNGF